MTNTNRYVVSFVIVHPHTQRHANTPKQTQTNLHYSHLNILNACVGVHVHLCIYALLHVDVFDQLTFGASYPAAIYLTIDLPCFYPFLYLSTYAACVKPFAIYLPIYDLSSNGSGYSNAWHESGVIIHDA